MRTFKQIWDERKHYCLVVLFYVLAILSILSVSDIFASCRMNCLGIKMEVIELDIVGYNIDENGYRFSFVDTDYSINTGHPQKVFPSWDNKPHILKTIPSSGAYIFYKYYVPT